MFRVDINYVDYNGVSRKKVAWFHLSEFEATEIALELPKDILRDVNDSNTEEDKKEAILSIAEKMGGKGIKDFVKNLVKKSYGVKSDDGTRFIKDEETFNEFTQTPAYSNFMMQLMRDDKASAAFVNGVIPPELASKIAANSGTTNTAADATN